MPVCLLSCFSRVWLFVTCWTVGCQAPPSTEILQARMMEWVAMPSSRGSSGPRDWTHISWFPHWQAGSLPLVPSGRPTEVDTWYQIWLLSFGKTTHEKWTPQWKSLHTLHQHHTKFTIKLEMLLHFLQQAFIGYNDNHWTEKRKVMSEKVLLQSLI